MNYILQIFDCSKPKSKWDPQEKGWKKQWQKESGHCELNPGQNILGQWLRGPIVPGCAGTTVQSQKEQSISWSKVSKVKLRIAHWVQEQCCQKMQGWKGQLTNLWDPIGIVIYSSAVESTVRGKYYIPYAEFRSISLTALSENSITPVTLTSGSPSCVCGGVRYSAWCYELDLWRYHYITLWPEFQYIFQSFFLLDIWNKI